MIRFQVVEDASLHRPLLCGLGVKHKCLTNLKQLVMITKLGKSLVGLIFAAYSLVCVVCFIVFGSDEISEKLAGMIIVVLTAILALIAIIITMEWDKSRPKSDNKSRYKYITWQP